MQDVHKAIEVKIEIKFGSGNKNEKEGNMEDVSKALCYRGHRGKKRWLQSLGRTSRITPAALLTTFSAK